MQLKKNFKQHVKTYTVDEAQIALERYCVYQDRCHQEVLEKLAKMNMISEAQELIVIHLIQHDYLNEERFAKSFTRGKFNQKKWGKIKISNQLKFKRVSAINIKTALNDIDDDDYLETLKNLTEKKLTHIKAKNVFEKRKKIMSFLQSKGYEFALILQIMDEVLK